MPSFLQNWLTRRPSGLPAAATRAGSVPSTVSHTESGPNASTTSSAAPSLTPATSITDAASVSTDVIPKQESTSRSSGRLRDSRSSVGSYNERVLAGSVKRRTREKTTGGATRTISGDTLVEGSTSAQDQLLQESEQALDRDWTLGALPGDSLKLAGKEQDGVKRRRSTRLDILDKASELMEKTSSALGKRGRESVDAGMEKLKALKGDRRSSLPPWETEIPSFEGPVTKKARFSQTPLQEESTTPPKSERKVAKRPAKRWLSQGLYVGQHREFDARLTESKNKAKKESKQQVIGQQTAILPLPMFAGQRVIENGRTFRLPFDVFNPLPPGQPKPEEWKKTHKNVFVGDAGNVWKKAKRLESSKCICTPETGCDENCFNRFMLYECDDSNCNIGGKHCTNRAFESLRQRTKAGGKYNVGVEVCKTPDRGYGVRSNRTFEPNQIIVEYTGEIITQEECDSRMHGRYKDAECYYLMDFDQQMILDATRGSIARFINHSCEPNCRMIKWTVSGKPRMALFAGDNGIMTGEELTYDYNFDPYSVKNVQECRCGSANCRGFLGPKPKEIKDALKPITTGKRKFAEVVEDAVQAVTKKRKIAVPSSVKNVLAKAKATTSESLTKAKAVMGSNAENERLVKKASKKSLRGWKGWALVDEEGNEIVGEKKVITYEKEKKKLSNGTYLERSVPSDDDKTKPYTPCKSTDVGCPARRRDSTKTKVGSVKENVVRTVRRSSKAGNGKTIRVIGVESG